MEKESDLLKSLNLKAPASAIGGKKALGRGLAALLGSEDAEEEVSEEQLQSAKMDETLTGTLEIPLSEIHANSEQPRQLFNEAKLAELADSIKEQGLIQPILLKKLSEHNYQIIAGERRWRASKLAGLQNIKAIIREEIHTKESNDLASLIENIQREELSPIELARAYGRMLSRYDLTQDALAKKLGISRVSLANTVRLLKLPDDVKKLIEEGRLSEGHGRALLTLEKPQEISMFAQRILSENLSVRDVEARVRTGAIENSKVPVVQNLSQNSTATSYQKSAHLLALEDELRTHFGTKVQIRGSERRGTIELFYSGQDSFNRLIHELRKPSK